MGREGARKTAHGAKEEGKKGCRVMMGTGSCHLFAFRTWSVALGVCDPGLGCERGAWKNLGLRWVFVSVLPPLSLLAF